MSPHSHPSTPQHPSHNMLPHTYSRVLPQPICLCPNCTSNPMYECYVVKNYAHIPSLGYPYIPHIRLTSHIWSHIFTTEVCAHSYKIMVEQRINRRNQCSNEQITNMRNDMSILTGENQYLVEVSVDGSQEE